MVDTKDEDSQELLTDQYDHFFDDIENDELFGLTTSQDWQPWEPTLFNSQELGCQPFPGAEYEWNLLGHQIEPWTQNCDDYGDVKVPLSNETTSYAPDGRTTPTLELPGDNTESIAEDAQSGPSGGMICMGEFTYRPERPDAYICNDCFAEFVNSQLLETHAIANAHHAYVCRVGGCQKRYRRRDTLVRHGRIHNSRVFACDICQAKNLTVSFKRKDHLSQHKRQCHAKDQDPGLDKENDCLACPDPWSGAESASSSFSAEIETFPLEDNDARPAHRRRALTIIFGDHNPEAVWIFDQALQNVSPWHEAMAIHHMKQLAVEQPSEQALQQLEAIP